jgi:hypothetical protein
VRIKLNHFFAVFILLSLPVCAAQESPPVKLILKVDGWSRGPFEGQESASCLRVYSDGMAKYFHRWNPGKVKVDAKTGKKSLLEQTVSVELHLARAELSEISGFLESDVVRALGESFAIPHNPIDYWESATIHIFGPNGNEKSVSLRDYGEASLDQRSQLPGALIVLMDKIEEIEKAAALKGKATKIPPDCHESLKRADP